MIGIAWLCLFWLIGTFCSEILHIPLPGNVIGMILLWMSLHFGWVKLSWVEQTSQFLLTHMMLFFAPYVVGVIAFYPLLADHWLIVGLLTLVGTLSVIAATGLSANWLSTSRMLGKGINDE